MLDGILELSKVVPMQWCRSGF